MHELEKLFCMSPSLKYIHMYGSYHIRYISTIRTKEATKNDNISIYMSALPL